MRSAKENGWTAFDKRLWQRNYYEHIIRDEESLREIREYIVGNPANRTHFQG
jgi:putative transposase